MCHMLMLTGPQRQLQSLKSSKYDQKFELDHDLEELERAPPSFVRSVAMLAIGDIAHGQKRVSHSQNCVSHGHKAVVSVRVI